MKKIKTVNAVCKQLGVSDPKEIVTSEKLQRQLVELAPNLTPEAAGALLVALPELGRVLEEIIADICGVGNSLEESERTRWETLRECAKAGSLNGEQLLEGMRILAKIKENEHVDWTGVFKRSIEIMGRISLVAVIVVGVVIGVKARDA